MEDRKSKKLVNIQMNNYVKPDLKIAITGKTNYILNDGASTTNKYFKYVEDRYIGSATNQAIIDAYTNYIYGEGIETTKGKNIKNILSNADLRLAIQDFKMQGQCAFQIIYSKLGSVLNIYHMPIATIGIKRTEKVMEKITEYAYCFDWEQQKKYPPIDIPAFGTSARPKEEILYIRNISSRPYFSLPDYQSGLEYCKIEEELSHYYLSHIENGLSFGHIINIVEGLLDTPESQEQSRRQIANDLTGSGNAGRFMISFNQNNESKTTIESIEVSDAHKQFEFLTVEARDKILMSHKVTDPSLFGVKDTSGFSSQSEMQITALKTLYRSQIKPSREILIDALESVLKINDPKTELRFKDFDELVVKEEEVITPTENVQMAKPRPPFHDDCKCKLSDGKIVNADACDFCKDIIKENY